METPNIAIGGELSGELCVVVGGTLQSEALGTESEEQSVRVIINILQTSDLDRVVTMAVWVMGPNTNNTKHNLPTALLFHPGCEGFWEH